MIKPALIFFSGRLGSGKTEISKRVAQRLSLGWNGFSYTLKQIARERNIEITRDNLQKLGESLVVDDLEYFFNRVIADAAAEDGAGIVVDGLRHISVRDYAKVSCIDRNIICIFVKVDDSVRQSRILSRDGISREELNRLETHQTELDVAGRLLDEADFVVDNSQHVESAVTAVLNALSGQGSILY